MEKQLETAQDLTLDTVDTPPLSGTQDMAESSSPPPSPELVLSLDNLSGGAEKFSLDETNDGNDEQKSSDEEESPVQLQAQARRGQHDRDAKRMETKLQRNLKQQQAHYARQRKLFEDLQADRNASPSSDGSSSPQSSDDHEVLVRSRTISPKRATSAKFRFQKDNLTSIGPLSRQKTHYTRKECAPRHPSPSVNDSNDDDDDNDDSHAQIMLRRIKEKARDEFHRQQILSPGERSSLETGSTSLPKSRTEFYVEMQQQEASNDALRRQLELLRRLQLENNRFRQESRSLRERNQALKERDEAREREVKRLRDDASELNGQVQRDRLSLAAVAQTTHKLKVTQKRLSAAQSEIRDLQAALQEANDARDQLQGQSQAEISDLVLEVKRWKRNTKQLRHQGNRTEEELDFYKKTIAALEEEVAERRTHLKEAKRQIAELSSIIEEKAAQCESVEASAADCVKRMEEGMEALQKTHQEERAKRKKMENGRSNMQMQIERMQTENSLLLDKQKELEHQLALFQEHWKERKQGYQEQIQRYAAQLEDHSSKHKSDATTIANIREERETLENRLAEVQEAANELKAEVAEEARTTQKQVEALRQYVEQALHNSNEVNESELGSLANIWQSRREEVWQKVPELQVVQAGISALQNEIMNIVHEFQRARHLVRQQGSKLSVAVERVTELEHMRAEDASKMKELREQRKFAEQAREIISQEKEEVLKWSEQACEKTEGLEAELTKYGEMTLRLRKELHRALETEESWEKTEFVNAEPLSRSFSALEKEINAIVEMRDRWRVKSQKQICDVDEAQLQLQSLEKELSAKTSGFEQSVAEVERAHSKNAQEQKAHYEQCIADVANERTDLEAKLKEQIAKVAVVEENNEHLQHVVDGFEQDLPVFATILHLFVLVVQPLILQVSELLAQKRLLSKENAEFAHAHEQIECIGQVLKEMIPTTVLCEDKRKERKRRLVFRRVVIAVFAMNRFQHFGTTPSSIRQESAYGLCAPLKVVKARKRYALNSQPTVIKVLPPHQTLSRLSLRPLLDRLKKMNITEKVAEAMESQTSGNMSASLGNVILKVVMTINPESKDALMANTNGVFHCQALLERRRRRAKPWGDSHDDMTEYDSASTLEEDIPTVTLIRKQILALGKRVEDLHYQRNSLQKENYEFQFQLDQQANSLKDMEVLQKKAQDLQDELAVLRSESEQELQKVQHQTHEKDNEIQSKEDELVEAQAKIEALQSAVSDAETRIAQMELDKHSLQRQLGQLKSSSLEEEAKADKSKAAARRQEDEVRSLKQAVKKAHELYQKVSWQLEQEVQEKSSLQTVVNHLRRQQEKADRELREEKLRVLEKSLNDDNEAEEDDTKPMARHDRKVSLGHLPHTYDRQHASSSMKAKRNTSIAPILDLAGAVQRTEIPTSTSRQRTDENRVEDEDGSECASPSASVSPLPSRVQMNLSCRSGELATFLNEWQQLNLPRALNDNQPLDRVAHFQDDTSASIELSPTKSSASATDQSWNVSGSAQTPKRRRRVEIEKVNAAVHDYMDRIDDKLSKMYGIPPSSAIQRSAVHHASNLPVSVDCQSQRDQRRSLNQSCEKSMRRAANCAKQSLKVGEVRMQQVHSDCEDLV